MVSVINNSNSVCGTVIVGFVLVVEFYLPSLPAKLKLKTKYALTVSCKGNNGNISICSIGTHFFSCYSYVLLIQKLLTFSLKECQVEFSYKSQYTQNTQ